MPGPDKPKGRHFGGKELHDFVAKASATLPPDIRELVMHWTDEAGDEAGAMLMLDILYHLRIHDDDGLSEKARDAVKNHQRDSQ